MSRTPAFSRSRWWPDGWSLAVWLVAGLLAVPVLVVLSFLAHPAGPVWQHLVENLLADYVRNTLLLLLGVGLLAAVIGVGCAWLVSACSFPGRGLFEWALLLPLAMPAYIIAYTYTGLLSFTGPVQSQLRAWTGWRWGDYWFPEIHSLGGACLLMALVLYPYVYGLARAAFLQQSRAALEVSRTLGLGPWRAFFRVALPLARPAVAAGVSLVLMESLADYGAVQYFGLSVFTTGIFRTWYGLGDAAAAAQLASLLLLFVFVLIVLERLSRRKARYHHGGARSPVAPYHLRGGKAALAVLACLLPLALGFVVPVLQLLHWAWLTAADVLDDTFLRVLTNTFSLALMASVLVLLLALLLAYGQRLRPKGFTPLGARVASLGYAVPGTVIAVGVMLPFAAIDNALDAWLRAQWGISSGLLLSGTLFALLFVYAVRFLAVGFQSVESGLARIRPSMDDAGRSLGLSPLRVLWQVHVPLLRGSVLAGLLLVFVDVLKELPATLILRPFNFNTLAVRTFELASDERLADASSYALAIVLAGLLPVLLLSRAMNASVNEESHRAA